MTHTKAHIALIAMILLLGSCQHKQKKETEQILNYYLSGLIAFDTDLKDHFPFVFEPGEIQEINFVLPSTVKSGGCSHAMIRTQPGQEKFNDISKIAESEYSHITWGDESLINLPDSIDYSDVLAPIFIPRFDDVVNTESGDGVFSFEQEYRMYIIETASGDYTNSQEGLLEKPYLPKDFEHGFSKGIAINNNSKSIIYWLLLW